MSWKIPLFDTDFEEEEIAAVSEVVRSGWLTMGNRVLEFEQEFSNAIGVKHAIAVSNGTAALHLANLALGIRAGDEVICPSLTFVATANSIRYTGGVPIFSDVTSLDNWNIGTESIKKVITNRTKAIIVVHYAGYPCEMERISDFAGESGLFIIEDCAHAPGVFYKGKALGTWGIIGCFSFFSNKNLSTGEGGMVTTDDDDLADKLRLLRSHGMTTVTLDRHKGHAFSYDVVQTGYNYRPTEITAALGIEQLKKLDLNNAKRRRLVKHYREKLKDTIPEICVPFQDVTLEQASGHIMPALLPLGTLRTRVVELLRLKGIQTSIHYRPVHTFSAYNNNAEASQLPLTSKIGNRCLTLPLYPALSYEQINMCVTELGEACKDSME